MRAPHRRRIIQQAVGFAVNPGVLQNSDNQSDCEWASTKSDTASVGLTISAYDDFLWQTGSSAGNSKAVPGIGDAAFKGWPTFAALNVKAKGYQVVLAIADFQVSQDAIDAGDLALAKLVLPRLCDRVRTGTDRLLRGCVDRSVGSRSLPRRG